MEELRNLQQMASLASGKFNQYNGEDFILPQIFKDNVTEINNSTITYNKYSAVIETSGNQHGILNIFMPNQWFYIASYFTDFYNELQKYKKYALKVATKERLKNLNGNALTADEQSKLIGLDLSDVSKNNLKRFITEYSWWGGAKTIDRGDFYVSPILNYARLVNASQSFVADLCAFLADKQLLVQAIITEEDNERQALANNSLPLQQIYYGAPGTGKSNGIYSEIKKIYKSETEEKGRVFRTTFHPDSDYSTFVGCYKPTLKENSGDITYSFVAQVFTKAYIAAWKMWAKQNGAQHETSKQYFSIQDNYGAVFTITAIDKDRITYTKKQVEYKSNIKEVWEKCWQTDKFSIPEIGWRHPLGWSIVIKINALLGKGAKKNKFDEGWSMLLNELVDDKTLEVSYIRQNYYLSLVSEDSITCVTKSKNSTRRAIKDCFDIMNAALTNVAACLASLLKERDSNNFDEAWNILTAQFNGISDEEGIITGNTAIFLIIEEINRGNCAQIFGDLFQLLDRDNNGFSTYAIKPDADLGRFIKDEFNKSGWSSDKYSNVFSGEELVLPPNLYIWATMNTSDQSLFPMDSAFKRRWTWEYTRIEEPEKDDDKMFIELENDNKGEGEPKTVFKPWFDVITTINTYIKKQLKSSDKQIGYWFVKSDCEVEIDGKTCKGISMNQFRDKVLFFLFDDAFKDDEDFARLFGYEAYLFVDLFSEPDLVEKVSSVLEKMKE